ncbi:hypothetical protein [Streptomyces sp. NPDC051001]|uniref:RIFT barrel domain-containing protein n=1 Tax=Streptomyces sp. NPDC051001 TaxID=3155795 RepID=UPI003441E073
MPGVDRRTVIKGAAAAAAAARFSWAQSRTAAAADADDTELHRLEGAASRRADDAHAGTTWGVPWARGTYRSEQRFRLTTAAGDDLPVQSRVTGHWPDGSVKWTAHAIAPGAPKASAYKLAAGSPAAPERKVTVTRSYGTDAQKRQLTGSTWKSALPAVHSRITAYAAHHRDDATLAKRARNEFCTGSDMIPCISTNSSAQWALAAIQNLALIGDRIPS